jgi:FkbM family methyltransferase
VHIPLRSRLAVRRPPPPPAADPRERVERALALYRTLVPAGGLVFDVGANVGDRTAGFVELGARVVAVEPQASCVGELRRRFGDRVEVVPAAVGAEPGRAELLVASASTISSLSPRWVEEVQRSGRFSTYRWDERATVDVTTLDALVAEHGVPDFCKVDVEGFELEALRGLSQPVGALSFEFDFELIDERIACVERLDSLGMREFNFSAGESLAFSLDAWVDAGAMVAFLRSTPREVEFFGDVYARRGP